MKIHDLRVVGIRCFEDTGDILCNPKCNIFVGKNNVGKSTILKAILGLQLHPFEHVDVRPGDRKSCYATLRLDEIVISDVMQIGKLVAEGSMRISTVFRGDIPPYNDVPHQGIGISQPVFYSNRPLHIFVPFLAKRKAVQFNQDISLGQQSNLDGTLLSLYSRIDLLATSGHHDHDQFLEAVKQIIGLPITTKASPGGKVAGFYFDKNTFVTLDQMGDGVSEMVALIVELCTEENKIFVLEEPETNLPSGLKALLAMIRKASERNQFFIATHSNVVVRELGGMDGGKVFRVFRDGEAHTSPSRVEEVERTPAAHMELLRELGYEFADFDLYEAWLFLEESSAERVIRDILLPNFAPELRGRLRTFSAGGATDLEPSVSEFQRLVVFVHLQPVYKNRLWIRADGDEAGKQAVAKIREMFPYFKTDSLCTFTEEQFEFYYPHLFQEKVKDVLAIENKHTRRKRKVGLLQEVLDWSEANKEEARTAWKTSADEQIKLLQSIRTTLAIA